VAGTAVQADGASSLLAVALAGEGDGTRSLQIPASLGVVLACVWGSKNKPKRRRNSRKKAFFCWLRAEVGAWQPNFSQTGDYHGTDFLRGSFDWLLGWVLPPACPIPRHGGIADHLQLPELAFPDARFLASCKISSFQERNRFFPITLVSGWSHFF